MENLIKSIKNFKIDMVRKSAKNFFGKKPTFTEKDRHCGNSRLAVLN
jgi:hypothetical protein